MTRQTATAVATALVCALAFSCFLGAQERPAGMTPAGMAPLPAGRYTPLFRTEKDPKDIAVPAFFLDVLPVTNGDYLEFVRAHPKWRRSQMKRLFADVEYLKRWAGDLEPGTNAPLTVTCELSVRNTALLCRRKPKVMTPVS